MSIFTQFEKARSFGGQFLCFPVKTRWLFCLPSSYRQTIKMNRLNRKCPGFIPFGQSEQRLRGISPLNRHFGDGACELPISNRIREVVLIIRGRSDAPEARV